MNTKIILVVAGVLLGALVGYLMRPEATGIDLGPVEIEVQGESPAESAGPLSDAQMRQIGLYALIGGAIGLVIGFVGDRRRRA
jgi:hypothetical protein